MKSEDRIQQECYIWFHNNFPNLRGLLFHVPNGGARNVREAAKFKKIGVVAGVSDLMFLYNGKTFLIELKNEIGKQSAKQTKWQNKVQEHNFEYYIIRNLEEFKVLIFYITKKWSQKQKES